MLTRFCLYGFLKNQRYFEPFLMLAFLEQGLDFFEIGILVAIHALAINVLEIPSGAIADTWGRRGCMMLSFVAYIFSFVVFAFASSFALFAGAMVLYGVGDSFRTGTHKAMIFEWLTIQGRRDERTKVYGVTRSWSKFGSALSSILAAAFVVGSGSYRAIFLFATIPCIANLINFMGYPAELDGLSGQRRTVGQTWVTLRKTLAAVLARGSMRRLTSESMAWEGIFSAVKDYIQPVLAALVVSVVAERSTSDPDLKSATAVILGATYTVLFLASGVASRWAHRFSQWSGGDDPAASRLWCLNLSLYGALTIAAWFAQLVVVAMAFVCLNVLENVWRPILISRFDDHADAGQGATTLSIESQAQRLATLVVAPAVGYCIDIAGASTDDHRFWPIGIIGAAAALLMWITSKRNAEASNQTTSS